MVPSELEDVHTAHAQAHAQARTHLGHTSIRRGGGGGAARWFSGFIAKCLIKNSCLHNYFFANTETDFVRVCVREWAQFASFF